MPSLKDMNGPDPLPEGIPDQNRQHQQKDRTQHQEHAAGKDQPSFVRNQHEKNKEGNEFRRVGVLCLKPQPDRQPCQ